MSNHMSEKYDSMENEKAIDELSWKSKGENYILRQGSACRQALTQAHNLWRSKAIKTAHRMDGERQMSNWLDLFTLAI